MTKLSDTSPEVERMLVDIYRRMPIDQKWTQIRQCYRQARQIHAAGVRLRNPQATDALVLATWIHEQLHLTNSGLTNSEGKESVVVDPTDLHTVLGVFRQLGITYALGGSIASSFFGIYRHTNDADISVEPFRGKEQQLVAALDPPYYIELQSVRQAVANRSSFNILNTATGFKVDVFVQKNRPFEVSALGRRLSVELRDAPGHPIDVLTPEDIIIYKLEWYRLGGEVSERQWTDIAGVFRIQGGKLDQAYLDKWAADIGVADLLARARLESSTP